jgi:hypothetical protein
MMTGCLPKVSKKAEEDTEGDDDEDAGVDFTKTFRPKFTNTIYFGHI